MSALTRGDNFTASDFCQLRNAVLHTGSSVVDGAGAKYSPFHLIGIRVFDDDSQLVMGYGAISSPKTNGVEDDCRIKITLNLTALLARMEKGVAMFLNEYPDLDREKGKWDCLTWGSLIFEHRLVKRFSVHEVSSLLSNTEARLKSCVKPPATILSVIALTHPVWPSQMQDDKAAGYDSLR